MNERVERELRVDWATVEEVWEAVLSSGWLADEVSIDPRPGGEATFRSGDWTKTGWVEDVEAPHRLIFWWAIDGEPASRVELNVGSEDEGARIRVIETRPLDVLDLVGIPLSRPGGATYGPALVAA
jgi:uncharacterized protein YndB with AHSA1/START domain